MAGARPVVRAVGYCSRLSLTNFVSRLIVQIVRTSAGAELDLVGAFGGQHIYSGLDSQGASIEVVGEVGVLIRTASSPEKATVLVRENKLGAERVHQRAISRTTKFQRALDCECHPGRFLQESLPLVGRLSNANFAQYERTRLPMLIMFLELPGERVWQP